MHQSIDCGGRGHGVFKDAIPLAEDEVAGELKKGSFWHGALDFQTGHFNLQSIRLGRWEAT